MKFSKRYAKSHGPARWFELAWGRDHARVGKPKLSDTCSIDKGIPL